MTDTAKLDDLAARDSEQRFSTALLAVDAAVATGDAEAAATAVATLRRHLVAHALFALMTDEALSPDLRKRLEGLYLAGVTSDIRIGDATKRLTTLRGGYR